MTKKSFYNLFIFSFHLFNFLNSSRLRKISKLLLLFLKFSVNSQKKSRIFISSQISKAFTLLELLIVIIIVWILIWTIGSIFSYKNIDRLNFDTCYVNIYGKLNWFFQEALSQRWVYTGDMYRTPSFYNIVFTGQELDLIYSWLKVKKIFFYWNWEDNINKCYTPTYHTFISGDITKVQIRAGLQVDTSTTEHSPMELYSGNELLPAYKTGVVYFYYCDHPSNTNCLQKYKIVIDPRSYMFKSYFCQKMWTNWKCDVRSQ